MHYLATTDGNMLSAHALKIYICTCISANKAVVSGAPSHVPSRDCTLSRLKSNYECSPTRPTKISLNLYHDRLATQWMDIKCNIFITSLMYFRCMKISNGHVHLAKQGVMHDRDNSTAHAYVAKTLHLGYKSEVTDTSHYIP